VRALITKMLKEARSDLSIHDLPATARAGQRVLMMKAQAFLGSAAIFSESFFDRELDLAERLIAQ